MEGNAMTHEDVSVPLASVPDSECETEIEKEWRSFTRLMICQCCALFGAIINFFFAPHHCSCHCCDMLPPSFIPRPVAYY
jgi:hypothetical protein